MACDGFDHGSRVAPSEGFMHLGKVFLTPDMVGTVKEVDRLNHRITVSFDQIGVIRDLPAHNFRLAELPT
jgi:hypothetical protein